MTRNPNSPKRHICTTSRTWSELPLDLLSLVFERLGFADFRRAKSACSSWRSASRQSVPNNQIPWLILFPEGHDNNTNNSCTLFNLEEKDKLYKVKDLGLDFAKSLCLATFRNWLLIQDLQCDLYIMNIFTKERINLPPLELQLGRSKLFKFTSGDRFFLGRYDHNQRKYTCFTFSIRCAVFWVNEITKDYVVIWGVGPYGLVYAKKGDALWTQISPTANWGDPVYKDHKLYLSCDLNFKILDFSGEIPQQIMLQRMDGFCPLNLEPNSFVGSKVVVTVTGDFLVVERRLWNSSSTEFFHVKKVYSSGDVVKNYQDVDSLGDEAMFYDLGITVLANDIEGLKKNSIYFKNINETEIRIYSLETKKVESRYKLDCSLAQFSAAQWFLPNFKPT